MSKIFADRFAQDYVNAILSARTKDLTVEKATELMEKCDNTFPSRNILYALACNMGLPYEVRKKAHEKIGPL